MKNEKVKSLLIGVLAAGLVSMTFAYALLSQRLDINSTAKVNKSTWDIHFANEQLVTSSDPLNSGTVKTALQLESHRLSNLSIELTKPGDSVSYTFDIYNAGTLDAKITEFERLETAMVCTDEDSSTTSTDATTVCNNLIYTLQYTDATTAAQTGTAIAAGTDLAENQILKANQHVNVTLTISYDRNSTYVPTKDVTVTGLDSYIIYTQN